MAVPEAGRCQKCPRAQRALVRGTFSPHFANLRQQYRSRRQYSRAQVAIARWAEERSLCRLFLERHFIICTCDFECPTGTMVLTGRKGRAVLARSLAAPEVPRPSGKRRTAVP